MPPLPLNSTQRQHLLAALVGLDHQLTAIETMAVTAPGGAVFPQYRSDLSAPEIEHQTESVRRARQAIFGIMSDEQLTPPAPLSVRQAVQAQWALAEIGLEELSPRSMKGYGSLDEGQVQALETLMARLQAALPQQERSAAAPTALAGALAAAAAAALDEVAAALAQADAAGCSNDELPLIAGDTLVRVAHRVCREHGLAAITLPALDIDSIPWRLDRPRWGDRTRSFRKQLDPLEPAIRAALRAYAARFQLRA